VKMRVSEKDEILSKRGAFRGLRKKGAARLLKNRENTTGVKEISNLASWIKGRDPDRTRVHLRGKEGRTC